jgi:hypothetical protein
MRFRPIVFVTLVTVARSLTCSESYSAFEGNKQDLAIVAAKFRENLDRLKTWQGKIKLTHRVKDTVAESGVLVECVIEFVYDAKRASYRYSITKIRDVSFNKDSEEPRLLLRTKAGLSNKDGYYELQFNAEKTASSRTGFLDRKPSVDTGWHYMSFDPVFFYTHDGTAHDRDLQILIDNFAHEALHGWVKRNGDSIAVRQTIDDDSVERVFSLAKGGNAVRVTTIEKRNDGSERVTESTWDWEKVNGVWVPRRAALSDQGQQTRVKDRKIDSLNVVFEWEENRVNEPLDEGALALASLGLRQGDRIVNKMTNQTLIAEGPQFPPRETAPTESPPNTLAYLLVSGLVVVMVALLIVFYMRRKKGAA